MTNRIKHIVFIPLQTWSALAGGVIGTGLLSNDRFHAQQGVPNLRGVVVVKRSPYVRAILSLEKIRSKPIRAGDTIRVKQSVVRDLAATGWKEHPDRRYVVESVSDFVEAIAIDTGRLALFDIKEIERA